MSPNTTPMLPSVSVRKPADASLARWASTAGSSAGAWSVMGLLMRSDMPPCGQWRRAFIASPLRPQYRELGRWLDGRSRLGLQSRRDRRRLAHQRNCHTAIGRHERVVRKQRIGIGFAGYFIETGRWHSLFFEDLANRIGAVGRQVPGSVAGLRRLTAGRGMAGDGNPVWRRLQRTGKFLDDGAGSLVGVLGA